MLFRTFQKLVATAGRFVAARVNIITGDGVKDGMVVGTRMPASFAQGPDARILPFLSYRELFVAHSLRQ